MAGITTNRKERRAGLNTRQRRSGRLVKRLGEWVITRLGCGLSRVFGSRARGALGILTYHRMTPWTGPGPAPTWNVTPDTFRRQLAGLLDRGYQAWPLRAVLDFPRTGRPVPPRTFVVTFDDGYENVYHHAWPVLCELKVPATVFLATAYLDSTAPFPFDDWPAAGAAHVPAEAWKPLTTAQCQEMLAQGLVELGCHTHTHAMFRGRPEALAQELAVSLAVLRTRFGLTEATFSFPFGIAGPSLAEAARRAGFLCGLTTEAMLVWPHSDPFTWGRFTVEDSDSAATLTTRLDGWYSLARRLWLQIRGPGTVENEIATAGALCPAGERT